jgi:hypothetical protein
MRLSRSRLLLLLTLGQTLLMSGKLLLPDL